MFNQITCSQPFHSSVCSVLMLLEQHLLSLLPLPTALMPVELALEVVGETLVLQL
jgi:hypothetical protein